MDGYSLLCSVFTSPGCTGEAIETPEAVPLWTPLDSIPYHEMWEDDARWLPGMLEGRSFRGYFLFESDKMLSHRVDWDVF